ncbi:hypothetical protein ACIF70_39525 [Actinacidiphila glaucinigra]|uniref:hypothetical protein n=1 Tax=Actinacidiphila glaucinigra TaxID=235986 RepID=UPI0037C61748
MAEYRFTLARIVRTGPITAHAVLDEWAHGQIIVSMPTLGRGSAACGVRSRRDTVG